MGRKVEIIQLQQEVIDKHDEVWNKIFELMAEGELVKAAKLADSIDNSEFESLQNEFELLGAEESREPLSTHHESEGSEEEDATKQGQNHVKSELKRVSSGNGRIRARAKGTCREGRSISQCSLQGPPRVLCKT